jgi:hypothetical protein
MSEITKVPTEKTGVKANPKVDQAVYAEFERYVDQRFHALYGDASKLYYDTAHAMFGEDVKPKDFKEIGIRYSQFYKRGGHTTQADYTDSKSSIEFYLPSYKLFKRMEDAKEDKDGQNELRRKLDTIISHELGHAVLSSLILENLIRKSDIYLKPGVEYPKWLVYDGQGKRLQESLAEAIGTYLAARINGAGFDNRSLAENMMESVYNSSTGAEKLHEDYVNDFEGSVKRLGLEKLGKDGASKEYTDEDAIREGRKTLHRYCSENQKFLLVYCMPRLGILLGLADHSEETLAIFIKSALENPGALGMGVSNYILDKDGSMSSLAQQLDGGNIERKNELLEKSFSEIAEKTAAEAYLRYNKKLAR